MPKSLDEDLAVVIVGYGVHTVDMRRSGHLLLYSQVSLWLFLSVCLVLMPRFLFESDEGGASNYGVYTRTSIPFTLAFGLCGVLTLLAAQALPEGVHHRRPLQRFLYGVGALNLLVLESTYMYQVSGVLDAVHIYAGAGLYIFEVLAGIWLWRTFRYDVAQTASLCMQLVGFCLLLMTFFGVVHVLLVAEAVTSAGFSVLLVRTVAHIAP